MGLEEWHSTLSSEIHRYAYIYICRLKPTNMPGSGGVLGRQRQGDLCEFEARLVYRVISRTDSIATGKPCLKNKNKNK